MNMPESFGNSYLGIVIATILIALLVAGDPDIFDAIRIIVLNYAGLE